MKRLSLLFSAWLLAGALSLLIPSFAFAQQKPDNDVTKSELRNFDEYLDQHQDVRADLTKNPSLVNDPAYLDKHPHLRDFLEHHPNTREELKENPSAFMQRERGFEKGEGGEAQQKSDITQGELRAWDEYLDKHHDVQSDLTKNPNLINDSAYLSDHPHLKEFLENHPKLREEFKENPKAFMNREHQYENQENKKPQ